MSHWLQRIGQSDGDTLVSLIAKLGNNTTAFWAAIGYEGATSLAAKLTAARAALIDQITALRMAELDPANLPADIDTLLARLTAARAGYLDELAAANIPADVDTLLTRLTALRAGYLDNLSAGAVALAATALSTATWTAARAALLDQITALRMAELDAINLPADIDTLLARLTAARAAYLDELAAANIPADVDTLLTRLTALRAGYLDNLSAGAVALAAVCTAARLGELDAANIPADVDTLLARLTAARAGYLDELAAANIPADIDTLLARLTAARAGYMDNINQAGLLSLTAARAGYLDYLATQETVATFSHPNDVTEDTVFTTAFLGLRTQVLGIWLDMVNHTQTQTIRVKCAIDGINYRTFSTLTWLATDDPGVLVVPFATNQNIRVTVQSSVLEGAARDLPYTLVTKVVE